MGAFVPTRDGGGYRIARVLGAGPRAGPLKAMAERLALSDAQPSLTLTTDKDPT